MKHALVIIIALFAIVFVTFGQTKAELEEQRKRTLNEISYVDNLLKTTSKEKTESLNSLKIIGRKLTLREEVIKGMKEEGSMLEQRISLNKTAIELMEMDLKDLKDDYALAVLNSYKSHKMNSELIYVLSARDFNQGYKRLKYLKQAAKFRRNEAEIISEIKSQIEQSKADLEKDLLNISELKSREEQQKNLLQGEQRRKQTIVKSLGNKEKQLKKELEDKKRVAKKIESEIAKLIEEERKRSLKTEMTPDQKLIGENFSDNKGLLPWPVEKGIITGHFGVQNHPVLKYVTEDNIGIEITSSGETPVRSIFKGEVSRVFAINGTNMAIIIRHGKYFSVYQNIVNVKVKSGQKVDTREEIGKVFWETGSTDNAVLKLMIFEDKDKLNPELWLSKKK
jgi:septal ring factor EnvC (AmiA/AmiB activator)